MQNPLYHLQRATLLSKQCCHLKRVFCFQMTNTAHYMSRHSKHRLNTDVLNGKHYYEMGKHQYKGLIKSIMPFHVQCYCTSWVGNRRPTVKLWPASDFLLPVKLFPIVAEFFFFLSTFILKPETGYGVIDFSEVFFRYVIATIDIRSLHLMTDRSPEVFYS